MKLQWTMDFPVDPSMISLMQLAADRSLQVENVQSECFVSIRLCDDETIQAINKEYRGVDTSTDVLSFPSVNYPKGATAGTCRQLLRREYDDEEKASFLGDLVISVPHVLSQAAQFGHSTYREAAYLLVHGLCHLMGYDHMEEKEKKIMRIQEEKILSSIGISREETQQDALETVLLQLAREAMKRSYSPYSGYPVGAALHCKDGRIFQGCNIENASFGLTICAERTAVFKAVSEGAREFDRIAIASVKSAPWPCGACRQVLNEFAPDIQVLVTWGEGQKDEMPLRQLLPQGFGPADLK